MKTQNYRSGKVQKRPRYLPYRVTIALVMAVMLCMPMMLYLVPAAAQRTTVGTLRDAEYALSITPMAPNLPADNKAYYVMVQLFSKDKPIEAPFDVEIRVLSSDTSVISLPIDTVVLKKGESIVKVDISTTEKPGIVSITASTEGTQSATADINTISLDSLDPTRLAVYPAPSTYIPDPKFSGLVYVQLLNSQGLPATTDRAVPVSLSSSEPTIATIASYITISSGQNGILVSLTPGQNIGSTTITASAAGLSPGTASVSTKGPVATKLVVEFAPDIIAAEPYASTLMSVQLRDDADVPVKASQTMTVEIRSSDNDVLDPQLSVQIPAGKSYATIFAQNRVGFAGEATVTATAPGLEAGFATVTAVQRSNEESGSVGKTLALYAAPSVLPPDNSKHETIVVAFFDSQGKPFEQSNHVFQDIILSSSNRDVGAFDDTAVVARTMYAVAKFSTRAVTGETTITAALAGYLSTQLDLRVDGSAPWGISLVQIPGIVQAEDKASNSLVVNLIDEEGNPVAAPKDMTIFLTSSDPEIATVVGSTQILTGKSHNIASVHTTLKQGQTTITGSSVGLNSGSVIYKTAGFSGSTSAYALGVYTLDKIPADGRAHEAVVVQLQDQNGNPVSAESDIVVTLSSSSFVGGTVQNSVTISEESNHAIATFTPSLKETSGIVITASSQGFKSVDAEMDITAQDLVVLRSGSIPRELAFGAAISVIVDVFSAEDIPVDGATVSVVHGGVTETIAITDESGHAEGEFLPKTPGQNNLVISVSKPGYRDSQLSVPLTLTKAVDITVKAQSEAGKAITAEIKVQGPSRPRSDTTKPGSPITLTEAKFGTYTLTPTAEIKTAEGIYNFVGWSDGSTANPRTISILDDTALTAIYSAQYMLKIENEFGTTTGSKFYPEGAKATISISPTSVGGILIDKNFAGWSGDVASASPTTDITMNAPKTVKAIWTDSYLKVFIIIGAAGGGGFAYYYKVFKPKREAIARDKAPDLDWFKT